IAGHRFQTTGALHLDADRKAPNNPDIFHHVLAAAMFGDQFGSATGLQRVPLHQLGAKVNDSRPYLLRKIDLPEFKFLNANKHRFEDIPEDEGPGWAASAKFYGRYTQRSIWGEQPKVKNND